MYNGGWEKILSCSFCLLPLQLVILEQKEQEKVFKKVLAGQNGLWAMYLKLAASLHTVFAQRDSQITKNYSKNKNFSE